MGVTILFDLDGTLIDTEKYFRIYWPKAAEALGYHMTDEQALQLRSLGRPFAFDVFKNMFGEDVDYWAMRQKRRELMEPVLERDGVRLKKGVKELLEYMSAYGHIAAIATASDVERTRKYLSSIGLEGYFSRIISATMVPFGKPAPDIYRYACEQLGIAPGDCYAVEDSPNGITSAYKAGLKVIMIPDQTPPDETVLPMLTHVYEDAGRIIELLRAHE